MKVLLTGFFALLAVNTFASETTEKLISQFPTEYNEMKQSCEQWATEENVTDQKRAEYVEKCIEDEISYLIEEDSVEEEQPESSPQE